MLLTANILQPLIDVFDAVLKFFHNSVGVGWGLSIVLLTVCVRAVLVPLTIKQFRSMQQLAAHQPELKALQAKYKDDKARQQEEMMKFYKENNVNPFGACLPLILQLPVFFSLYYLLRSNLRGYICPQVQNAFHAAGHHGTVACGLHHGAQFLFIGDLTNKATGVVLVVLMVLYVGSQLLSSLLMASATMDSTQRWLMIGMPLVFVFLFISFPAGVIVYWITTNLWTIVQQLIVRRIVGPMPTPAVAGGGGGGGGGSSGTSAKSPARAPSRPSPKGAKTTVQDGAKVRPQDGAKARGQDGAKTAVQDGAKKNARAPAAKTAVGGMLKRRLEPASEPSGASSGHSGPSGPPPRPPRKKKKRSGRRR